MAGLQRRDSVYVVRRGGNHGWPRVVGVVDDPAFVPPVLYYPDRAVPPGGMLFYTGTLMPAFRDHLFLASLRAEHVQHIVVDDGAPPRIARIERWWTRRWGRLRALAQGPDGALYLGTSNADGRARREPRDGDILLRVAPVGAPD